MIGERVGPYRVEAELGSGGMGTVYLATVEDPGTVPVGEQVALKLIHPHLLTSPDSVDRFQREAAIGSAVRHPNVVRTLDAGALDCTGGSRVALVMEYVEGQDLRGLLDQLGCLPEHLCRHVAAEVARGLAAIHEAGAIHRDLKPENVLITPDHQVKVMDLGVARLVDEVERLSRTGVFVGSVAYAAPEQFHRDGLDVRADLHGLGILLYELATGRNPYAGDEVATVMANILHQEPRRLGEVNSQVSPFLEEVVHTLLEKDRERRFASATSLLAVLDEAEDSAWWSERVRAIRAATHRPPRRIRVPRETAVYGREAELERLQAAFAKVQAGDGRVVFVHGEAGIGKTRIVDEFVGDLQRDGQEVNFLYGSYPPGGAATAAGAFSTAYREHFGDDALDAEHLEPYLGAMPPLIPAFGALLRGTAPPPGAEAFTADSLGAAFIHATRALAAERPTVLLIDDLHFAPEEGRSLFAALCLAVPGHRVLLVGTARPTLSDEWLASLTRLEHVERMDLPRLGAKDLVRLLGDSFRSQRLAEELAGKIALKSDGNPFFVFEIIRGLREGQLIERRPDGTWVTTQVIAEIRVPESVLELVSARVSTLDERERDVLDVAACLGFEFDPLLVGEVLGLPRIPLLKMLAGIERRHGLARSAGLRYVFDHHQVQEALYAELPELLRREYHAALADAMERRAAAAHADPAEVPGALAVDLADHFLRGGAGPRALRYLDAAMDHLETGQLRDPAAALAARALEEDGLVAGAARVDLQVRTAWLLADLGRNEAVAEVFAEALPLAEELGDPRRLAIVQADMGWHFMHLSQFDEAERSLRAALDYAVAHRDEAIELRAVGDLGTVLGVLGRGRENLECMERALALARKLGDRHKEAGALGHMGNLMKRRGRFEEARACYEREAALAREAGRRETEAYAALQLGALHRESGALDASRASFEAALSTARELGLRRIEEAGHLGLATLADRYGHFAECTEYVEHALAICSEMGDRERAAMHQTSLGYLAWCCGRFGPALRGVEGGLANYAAIGATPSPTSLSTLALVRCALGDPDAARAALAEAFAICERGELRTDETELFWWEGVIALEAGDAARGEAALTEAVARARELGQSHELAGALAHLGGVYADTGRPGEARAALEEALSLARAADAPDGIVLASCHLASISHEALEAAESATATYRDRVYHTSAMAARLRLWRVTGDPGHRAEARRLLKVALDHAPPERHDAMLERVALFRAVASAGP